MRFCKNFLSKWTSVVLFTLLFIFAAQASDHDDDFEQPLPSLILKDHASGKYFYLVEDITKTGLKAAVGKIAFWDVKSKYIWHETTEKEIRTTLAGKPKHYAFRGGQFRINEARNKVEYKATGSTDWQEIYATRSDNVHVKQVFMDGENNRYVQLEGEGVNSKQGYFQVRFSKKQAPKEFVPASWPSQVNLLKNVIENPYRAGLIMTNSAKIYHQATPTKGLFQSAMTYNFNQSEFLPKVTFLKTVVSADNKLFAQLSSGSIYLLTSFGKLRRLALPEEVSASSEISIYSSVAFQNSKTANTSASASVSEYVPLSEEPISLKTFLEQKEAVKKEMHKKVLEQDRYTDVLVDQWWEILLGGPKKHRSVLVTGLTGTGKSFAPKELAKILFKENASEKFLEIDMTKFSAHEGSLESHSLLGASPGTKGQDEFQGILPMFLANQGKQENIVVFNEIEKSASHIRRALMEALDTGELQGGDGKKYKLNNSLWIFTGNKGASKIFPRGRKSAITREDLERRISGLTDKNIKDFFLEPDPSNLEDTSKAFDPEFLQRIDRAAVTIPLSPESVLKIAEKTADRIANTYWAKFKIYIDMHRSVAEHIVDVFYAQEDGVRAIEKAVERVFSDFISEAHKRNELDHKYFGLFLKKNPEALADTKILAIEVDRENKTNTALFSFDAYERKDNMRQLLTKESERNKLLTLNDALSKNVFGQEEAIQMTARAIRARRVDATSHHPVAMLYLGATGTGKTELGKTLAKAAYGDENRFERFDMGNLKDQHQLSNIFNAPRGYVGATTMTRFEQFLNEYPEGGVLLFDEISNMGRDLATKHSMLMTFYNLIDEGSWTSSQGKVYDLSKHCLLFSGNDLAAEFAGLPNDDLQLAQWQMLNKKDVIQERLVRQHGWPQPLIGRFKGNIILFKPVTADVRRAVAEKAVKNTLNPIIQHFGMNNFEVEPNFYQMLGDAFFSHAYGARSIQGVVEDALVDRTASAILDSYKELSNGATKLNLKLALSDNYANIFMYKGVKPPQRSVTLTLKAEGPDGYAKEYVADVSKDAAEKRLSNIDDLRRTAFHEAGHAVANDPNLTGQKTEFVTVKSAGFYGGYARYRQLDPGNAITRRQVIAHIGRMLGGNLGETQMGLEPSQGWQDDLDKAKTLAFDAVVKYGLTENPFSIPKLKGDETTNPLVLAEVEKLLKEGREYAIQQIQKNWHFFRLVSAKLIRDKEIDGVEIDRLYEISQSLDYQKRFENASWADAADFKASRARCLEALLPKK